MLGSMSKVAVRCGAVGCHDILCSYTSLDIMPIEVICNSLLMHCISRVKVCVVSAVVMVVMVAVVDATESVTATPVSDMATSTDAAAEKQVTCNTIYLFPGTQTLTVPA